MPEYAGWKNYETQSVALHIKNSKSLSKREVNKMANLSMWETKEALMSVATTVGFPHAVQILRDVCLDFAEKATYEDRAVSWRKQAQAIVDALILPDDQAAEILEDISCRIKKNHDDDDWIRAKASKPKFNTNDVVNIDSAHFPEKCMGKIATRYYDECWIYQLVDTSGDVPSCIKNAIGEVWVLEEEIKGGEGHG